MNADRWNRVDELLDAVLDSPPAERERILSEKANGDEDLIREVRSLLRAQIGADAFLETSAIRVAARNLADDDTVASKAFLWNKTFGTFRVEKLLGAGGMGEVYLAQDEKLERKVALKILPAEYISSDDRVRRFQLEARSVSILNHPNIVTVYDVGTVDGLSYIATEYVEGKTVRELIGSDLTVSDVLTIVMQACEALSIAHAAGIIHRDIKPENIMVRPDGYVKILDFGLVKLSGESPPTITTLAQTAKGIIIGTPAYMSPEQVADEKVDHRTDLWSIGIVLYELLTGVNPYKRETRQATFHAILSLDPPPASSINPEVPSALDHILEKALEKDADLSYQNASDLRSDLKRIKRIFDSSDSNHASSRPMGTAAASFRSRRPMYFFGSTAVLILLLIPAWFYFLPGTTPVADAPDWSLAQNVQLTDAAGTEFYPSLSPDGKSYVYAAESNGHYDIFFERIGGKNPRNLTEGSLSDDTQPVFSPDGERIAFRSDRHSGGIFVMGASGENPRRVADFGFHPSWSPDGKAIVVSTHFQHTPQVRYPSALWIIDLESGDKRLLIEGFAVQPAWSPAGHLIAYWFTESGGRRDIAVVSPNGGEPIVLTDAGNTNWNPVWSPDGTHLYFASDRGGSMAFWRVAIDERSGKTLSPPEIVSTPANFNRHLSFSRDNKRMIYVQTTNQSNLKSVGFNSDTGKPIGEPVWITQGDRELHLPELSPDGTTYAARLITRTQEDIVLMNADGSNSRELTSDRFFDRYPRWSPDGRSLIFASDRSGKYEIWKIDADGSNLRQLTSTEDHAASIPAWGPDGLRISFDDAQQSYILNLTKSVTEQNWETLPHPGLGSYFRAWDWSSDGKKLIGYFEGGTDDGLAVYYFETKSYKRLNDLTRFPYWLPDDRRVIYSDGDRAFILDTESGRTTQIEELAKERIRHPRVSNDGTLLYYTYPSSESDIWLLDLTQP